MVVMLKEPRPGRVKTRLAEGIGKVGAAWWFRHQSARLIRRLEDPRWRLVLAVAPDAVGLASRVWTPRPARIAQGGGDLGSRMTRVFRSLPPGPVCIVGSDVPGIERVHVARAFAALGGHDAVLGPAPDGGYWLIGMKRSAALPRDLLAGVRWSTEHAMADTEAALAPRRIAHAAILRDVDHVDDLAR